MITKNIFLIRPLNFGFNEETATSNVFQTKLAESEKETQGKALNEFDGFIKTLKSRSVNTYVFEDTSEPKKPDAIFPNNWISFHPNGTVILYPMLESNRRIERRLDIIETLKLNFNIKNVIDFSKHEKENIFLEGTGSIVFDHKNKIAYACLSPRTDKGLFIEVSKLLNYKPIYFNSCDENGTKVYHTNVIMCIAQKFVIICLESITSTKEKDMIVESFNNSGHKIIEISFKQMSNYAGNMLSLQSNENDILVLSQRAYNSLSINQINEINKYSELLPIPIERIETVGGGSARCMISEIFLDEK